MASLTAAAPPRPARIPPIALAFALSLALHALLLLVPRHPQRFDAVAAELAARRLATQRRSADEAIAAAGIAKQPEWPEKSKQHDRERHVLIGSDHRSAPRHRRSPSTKHREKRVCMTGLPKIHAYG